MNKWNMVKLSDVFTLQMGKTPSRNNPDYWNGNHQWLSIADFGMNGKYINKTKECITDAAVAESGIKATPHNTVVMSFKLSIGKTAITVEDIFTNEAIMSFIDKGTYPIDVNYIYQLFSGKDWSKGTNKAVMGTTLNKATLSQITIPLPPIETQHQIADNLEKVSKLIDLCNTILNKLDILVKSRFVEMFGDVVLNPKKWVKELMGNYMTLLTDFSANGSYEYIDSNVVMYDEPNYALMVRTTDLEKNDFENDVKYIDENAYNILSKSKLFGDEIIMNKIGSAGKVYLMPKLNRPASLGRNAFMFRFNSDINIIFLYHLLTTEYGVVEIQQHVRGAVTKTITKNAARSIRIIVPPIKLQNQFADFVSQIDKSKLVVKLILEKAETLKKSLMQDYFG